MSGSTIYDLIQRSIARPPFGEGKESRVYEIDDPAFHGYLLKVLKRGMDANGRLSSCISPQDNMFGVRMGFPSMNVGQIVAAQGGEGRYVMIVKRVPGVTLEEKLEQSIGRTGNGFDGAREFLEGLIALPTRGYKEFFRELNNSTRLNYGLDIVGTGNTLVDADGLHNVDIGGRYSSDNGHFFAAEHFNHLEAVLAHIRFVVEDRLGRFEPTQQAGIETLFRMLHEKMERASQRVGFPKDAHEVSTWITAQKFYSRGIRTIPEQTVSMSDTPDRLLKLIQFSEKFDRTVPFVHGC